MLEACSSADVGRLTMVLSDLLTLYSVRSNVFLYWPCSRIGGGEPVQWRRYQKETSVFALHDLFGPLADLWEPRISHFLAILPARLAGRISILDFSHDFWTVTGEKSPRMVDGRWGQEERDGWFG